MLFLKLSYIKDREGETRVKFEGKKTMKQSIRAYSLFVTAKNLLSQDPRYFYVLNYR